MQLTSGFAGGQRNGAAAFAVAINNFTDPTVLLTIAIISSISTVIFSLMANYIGQGKTRLEEKEVK